MRVGKNPFKGVNGKDAAYIPKKVTVCMITFIPDFTGYYSSRFDVMKISLASLIKHTEGDFDILVLDNGSCGEVKEYLSELHTKGLITYLILSANNLGYNGGLNFIFSVAPGDYIAYGDDDVFYHPGWLPASLTIAETYPRIGYVTASPVRSNMGHFDSQTLSFPNDLPAVEQNDFTWPNEWDEVHANSLGANISNYRKLIEDKVVKIYRYKNVEALPVSTHFQYLFPKQRREIFLPFKYGNLMSSEIKDENFNMTFQLDKKLDDNGFIKISTAKLLTEHLGNVISERSKFLVKKYEILVDVSHMADKKTDASHLLTIVFKVLTLPGLKGFFRFINNLSFKILNWKTIYRKN